MCRRHDLVLQYIPRLRRYARALLGDADRAEDLVQETLSRALGKLHFWQRGSDMRAWLFTIMHNQFVNDCRRVNRRPDKLSLDTLGTEPEGASSAETHARLWDIEQALMRLPEEQRAVLLLVGLEGLSYAECARVLDIPQGTLMSRLHRARERLRDWLGGAPADIGRIRRVK